MEVDVRSIKLLGARVLVKPQGVANEMTKAGLIVPAEFEGRMNFEDEWAEVVSVGEAVAESWAKPGDNVLVSKHGGASRQFEDGYYRIVMEEDIVGRIFREGENG